MSKVTSKLQVTIPKALADKYGIKPGDQIDWQPLSDSIRLLLRRSTDRSLSAEERLRSFDEGTERQRQRDAANPWVGEPPADRGWTRDELYGDRGRPR